MIKQFRSLLEKDMNFGNPTPVFYQIVFVLLIALLATSCGVSAVLSFFVSTLISYTFFIASVGGFKSSEAFMMGAGWGILVMFAVIPGALIAVLIGKGFRALWLASRKSENAKIDDSVV